MTHTFSLTGDAFSADSEHPQLPLRVFFALKPSRLKCFWYNYYKGDPTVGTESTIKQAKLNLQDGTASWIVVSGKMRSGKDYLAPHILPAMGYTKIERLGYGDTIRVEADQAINLVRGSTKTDEQLSEEIIRQLNLRPEHSAELVRLLKPLVSDPASTITAAFRSDEMRHILIEFGSTWRTEDDEAYWTNKCVEKSFEILADGVSVYLTGGRFIPDVAIPKANGATIIRLEVDEAVQARRIFEADGIAANPDLVHAPSETALDDWLGFDVRVHNNGNDKDEVIARIVKELKKVKK